MRTIFPNKVGNKTLQTYERKRPAINGPHSLRNACDKTQSAYMFMNFAAEINVVMDFNDLIKKFSSPYADELFNKD